MWSIDLEGVEGTGGEYKVENQGLREVKCSVHFPCLVWWLSVKKFVIADSPTITTDFVFLSGYQMSTSLVNSRLDPPVRLFKIISHADVLGKGMLVTGSIHCHLGSSDIYCFCFWCFYFLAHFFVCITWLCTAGLSYKLYYKIYPGGLGFRGERCYSISNTSQHHVISLKWLMTWC